jgi:hypothetical protein
MKIEVFWDVMLYCLIDSYQLLEESASYIFRVEEIIWNILCIFHRICHIIVKYACMLEGTSVRSYLLHLYQELPQCQVRNYCSLKTFWTEPHNELYHSKCLHLRYEQLYVFVWWIEDNGICVHICVYFVTIRNFPFVLQHVMTNKLHGSESELRVSL